MSNERNEEQKRQQEANKKTNEQQVELANALANENKKQQTLDTVKNLEEQAKNLLPNADENTNQNSNTNEDKEEKKEKDRAEDLEQFLKDLMKVTSELNHALYDDAIYNPIKKSVADLVEKTKDKLGFGSGLDDKQAPENANQEQNKELIPKEAKPAPSNDGTFGLDKQMADKPAPSNVEPRNERLSQQSSINIPFEATNDSELSPKQDVQSQINSTSHEDTQPNKLKNQDANANDENTTGLVPK